MLIKQKILDVYCHGLEENDTDKVISLFSEKGLVHSPLYGLMPHKEFYKTLFDNTYRTKVELKNFFSNSHLGNAMAAHLFYVGGINGQPAEQFECVDIFDLDSENKIKKLTIIRDTRR